MDGDDRMTDRVEEARDRPTVGLRADDGVAYVMALPGVTGELVRTGGSDRTTDITLDHFGDKSVAHVDIGFPIAGEATADDDVLIAVSMLQTPPGGMWDGVELERGSTFVYGPGSSQVARDPIGLRFALATFRWEDIEAGAAVLGRRPPTAGHRAVYRPDRASLFTRLFEEHTRVEPAEDAADRLLEAVVELVSDPGETTTGARGWTSQQIVCECLEHLERTATWRPPVLTLCRAVGVSERRLQQAFSDVTGLGVASYLRHRALQATRLALSGPAADRVTDVAADHGFAHAGRFAADYHSTYGELPSVTVRRARSESDRGEVTHERLVPGD
ncbi:MAG: AraC family transcriptional regulator [Ilumatobacter sp.]|nr:AraC family transcriptional regulator [Ilumatobacter sp.]